MTDLTWEAFRDRVPGTIDLAIVPTGTIEAHGGLPLGTDTLIAEAIAAELAPRLEALVAPPVAYGVTNTLLPYPGSTTVSSATFEAYLFEAAAGLVDAGFRRMILLNGHGGQSHEVAEVVRRLWAEKRAFAMAVEWWGPAEPVRREIYGETISGHAGIGENALVQAIAPELVDAARSLSIRRAPIREGVRARPFPATIMLEHEERHGEGTPVIDAARASEFFRRTVDAVERAIRDVLDGWRELRP